LLRERIVACVPPREANEPERPVAATRALFTGKGAMSLCQPIVCGGPNESAKLPSMLNLPVKGAARAIEGARHDAMLAQTKEASSLDLIGFLDRGYTAAPRAFQRNQRSLGRWLGSIRSGSLRDAVTRHLPSPVPQGAASFVP
jgi:hypothetical protein